MVLLPLAYLIYRFFANVYSANFYLQVQYKDGDTWKLEDVKLPFFLADIKGGIGGFSSPSEWAMSMAMITLVGIMLYMIVIFFLTRNIMLFTKWYTPFMIWFGIVGFILSIFWQLQKTAFHFSQITETGNYISTLEPLIYMGVALIVFLTFIVMMIIYRILINGSVEEVKAYQEQQAIENYDNNVRKEIEQF